LFVVVDVHEVHCCLEFSDVYLLINLNYYFLLIVVVGVYYNTSCFFT